MKNLSKCQLLLTTLLSAAVIGSTAMPAFAQEETDEIIVTGTRLNVNPNLASPNPVLAVSDEEISARGTVNIEDLTNNLPQVFAGQASEVANGASGTATLNLRGLGSVRTLTLIDGRRLPYGSSRISSPNLDLVPTNLVERVEILTGGASAVYGSDAIGGVANFILKRDFEGFEVDGQYSINQNSNGIEVFDKTFADFGGEVTGGSWDGDEINLSATMGMNSADGKGNVILFASFQDRQAITQDDRSFSQCALQSDSNGYGCFGSANFRLFFGPGGSGFQEENGNIVRFAGTPDQRYNYGPLNYFQRPAQRIQIYSKGHY
ncbi:MAG TPA: TonB-dependent receptor, partial [Gammaproteobacteria bacterium]|nr:TonB-dependent receptor [Gammaproteobacteria bacterium]